MEVKKLGNIYGFDGGNYAGNVYDTDSLAPTINTCQGGNKQPLIIINDKGRTNKPSSIRENIAPTIVAESHDNLPKVLTPKRTEYGKEIRKAYENGEVKESRHNMTQLEPRKDGVSNTLTTVQKDNLLLESTICAMRGRNPDNPSDRAAGSPTEQRLEVKTDGTTNTLTSVQKDNLLLENTVKVRQATKDPAEFELGGVMNASYPDSKTRRGWAVEKGNISPTITAAGEGGGNVQLTKQYRIRKLTPKECGRLMGVSDEDIDKMAAVNSNAQLYKQFGNSIVVDVMVEMFRQLF